MNPLSQAMGNQWLIKLMLYSYPEFKYSGRTEGKDWVGISGGSKLTFYTFKKKSCVFIQYADVQKVQQLFVLAEQKLVEVRLMSLQAYLPAT